MAGPRGGDGPVEFVFIQKPGGPMTTLTLFDCGETLSPLDTARRRRDEQMRRVAEAAERHREDFRRRACAFVLGYLAEHGPTSGEALSSACKAAGHVPHDDRAFGPVYYQLSRAAKIVRAGSVARVRGNGTSGGNLWRLA